MQEIFAYVRVSTREQNVDRQLAAMRDRCVPKEHVFIDYMSGKDFSRPRYQKMLRVLRPGALLYIHSIDRLGRNYREIIEEWRRLTKEKRVDIVVLDMPLLDTRRGKDLMGTFLADIVLQVLSFVAENERRLIRTRQAEGIREAKRRGVRFGRPQLPLPENFSVECLRYEETDASMRDCASACGMAVSTFYRHLQEWRRNRGE